MAEVTASMVKELREATGLGMMECKKALDEAGGDLAKACCACAAVPKRAKRPGESRPKG